MKNIFLTIFLFVIVCLSVVGCAHQPTSYEIPYSAPGFFMGLWNGISAPLALIGSIFMNIRMYAFPNSGIGYDFGFIIGLMGFWGGGTVIYNR